MIGSNDQVCTIVWRKVFGDEICRQSHLEKPGKGRAGLKTLVENTGLSGIIIREAGQTGQRTVNV